MNSSTVLANGKRVVKALFLVLLGFSVAYLSSYIRTYHDTAVRAEQVYLWLATPVAGPNNTTITRAEALAAQFPALKP